MGELSRYSSVTENAYLATKKYSPQHIQRHIGGNCLLQWKVNCAGIYEVLWCAFITIVFLDHNIFGQFFTGRLPSGDTVLQTNLMLKTQKIIHLLVVS